MQRFAGPGPDPFGQQTQDEVRVKPLSVQIPDVHESMKLAGVQSLDPRSRGYRTRILCCCGVAGCAIGPMTQVVEEQGGGSST